MEAVFKKRVKSVRISNKRAVELINAKASRDFRSASGTATLVIIEALSRKESIAQARENQVKIDKDLGVLTATKQIEKEAEQKKSEEVK